MVVPRLPEAAAGGLVAITVKALSFLHDNGAY